MTWNAQHTRHHKGGVAELLRLVVTAARHTTLADDDEKAGAMSARSIMASRLMSQVPLALGT